MPEAAVIAPVSPPVPPGQKIDPIKAFKLRYQNHLTYQEIADQFGATKQSVIERIRRLSALLMPKEQQEEYEQVKVGLLSSVEHHLLASLADPAKLEKASLNNIAYSLTQIHVMKRLEENKSTANVGLVSKLVQQSDAGLFKTTRGSDEAK